MKTPGARWWFWLMLVGGCQCLEPVSEELDGGAALDAGTSRDAGALDAGLRLDSGVVDGGGVIDAGVDAGLRRDAGPSPWDAGSECVVASDCRGTPWVSSCGLDAGFSCIHGFCVAECFPSERSCTSTADCLVCPGEADLCALDTCPGDAFAATITQLQCRPGVMPQLRVGEQLTFVPIRGASCELSVSAEMRGLGQSTRDGERQWWFVRELGGFCVGESLPANAVAAQVACPWCTFEVTGL